MAQLIVERSFETPLSDTDIENMANRLLPCMAQYGGQWISTYLSVDRRRTVCAFEAPDAESVRMAYRLADVPMERVWPADILTPADTGPLAPPGTVSSNEAAT